MKGMVYYLKKTGARWVFLGDSVFVDPNYLEDFMKEHPETKMEGIGIEAKTEISYV